MLRRILIHFSCLRCLLMILELIAMPLSRLLLFLHLLNVFIFFQRNSSFNLVFLLKLLRRKLLFWWLILLRLIICLLNRYLLLEGRFKGLGLRRILISLLDHRRILLVIYSVYPSTWLSVFHWILLNLLLFKESFLSVYRLRLRNILL